MKIVESPVKKFPGSVTFRDPLPYTVILLYERAARSLDIATGDIGETFLPVLFAAISEWNLEGIPENPTTENFPGSPRGAINRLLAWLLKELTALYKGNEDTDPNG